MREQLWARRGAFCETSDPPNIDNAHPAILPLSLVLPPTNRLMLLKPKYHKAHAPVDADGGLLGAVHLVELYMELIAEGLAGR